MVFGPSGTLGPMADLAPNAFYVYSSQDVGQENRVLLFVWG